MAQCLIQKAHSLSAGIATSGAELVLVVDLVGTVTGHARRRHIGLLHAVDGHAGRVVFAANLGVAGVGSVLVEGRDLGDVLAVGLAGVLDSLEIEVLATHSSQWSQEKSPEKRGRGTYLVLDGSARHDW